MAVPGTIASAIRNFKRAWPLMRDERVPTALKAAAAIMALFIISPLDIFADIPILGLLDDAVLLTLLCMLFVRLAEGTVVRHETDMMKNVSPPRREGGGPPALQ
jgi:uncharacterized membrane protein YkvA (DUF1232 family)